MAYYGTVFVDEKYFMVATSKKRQNLSMAYFRTVFVGCKTCSLQHLEGGQ